MVRSARFEFFQDRKGRWYFRLVGANWEIVGPSQGYASKQKAKQTAMRLPDIANQAKTQLLGEAARGAK